MQSVREIEQLRQIRPEVKVRSPATTPTAGTDDVGATALLCLVSAIHHGRQAA